MKETIQKIVKDLFAVDIEPVITRPEVKFGDFSSNVALQLAGRVGQNPRQVAEKIAHELKNTGQFTEVSIAGPGFLNVRLSDQKLVEAWSKKVNPIFKDQVVIAEYSDPNPFKVLHAGHLYTSIVGDAIANLVENAGGDVHRVNFGGDVGLHVGKTMWAIKQEIGEDVSKLSEVEPDQRADWLAKNYVKGTAAYEDDEVAHADITDINKKVYQLHRENDRQSSFAQIYWTTRQWSYDYFDAFYEKIGSHFEKYYPESMTAERGLIEVEKRIGSVFEKSNGAVIFDGDKYVLHTRVFINKEGLPTYETKDIGLIHLKHDDYKFDRSIIITADEQKQYMQVVLKAVEQFAPKLAKATTHLTHGIVKLAGGVKMSSRKGNFLRAIDVLNFALDANEKQNGKRDEVVALGAVKYAFVKQRMGGDIIYDPVESVSMVGNSGPYLQYAHARAKSILNKSAIKDFKLSNDYNFDEAERSLALKIGEYVEVVDTASVELLPHLIATYLYELAGEFNRFYEKSRIVGDQREALRLALVAKYAEVLSEGLKLLGIEAPESM